MSAEKKKMKGKERAVSLGEISQRQASALLALAMEDGDDDQLERLLSAGADASAMWSYPRFNAYEPISALSAAASWGSARAVRALLAAGADATGAAEAQLSTRAGFRRPGQELGPLGVCCASAEPDEGGAAARKAASARAQKILALMEAGADPLTEGAQAWRALLDRRPRDAAHPMVFEALARGGVDVDTATEEGNSALWVAAGEGDEAMVKALLALGADPLRESSGGDSPADLSESESPLLAAQRSGHSKVEALLHAEIARRALEAELPPGIKKATGSL